VEPIIEAYVGEDARGKSENAMNRAMGIDVVAWDTVDSAKQEA
jgi:hypothetical protein